MTQPVAARSSAGAAVYAALCGSMPSPLPWHFQWLSARALRRGVADHASGLGQRVLDVGTGSKPYAELLSRHGVREHVGLDLEPSAGVDVVISPGKPWPVADASADGVLCTQVLEFVEDPAQLLGEVVRCLRPGGRLVLTAPFVFNEHGPVDGADRARWTVEGLRRLLPDGLDVSEARPLGGPGSAIATVTLNGIDAALSGPRRWLKLLLLPVWLPVTAVVNLLALLVDALVRRPRTYLNALVVAERR